MNKPMTRREYDRNVKAALKGNDTQKVQDALSNLHEAGFINADTRIICEYEDVYPKQVGEFFMTRFCRGL